MSFNLWLSLRRIPPDVLRGYFDAMAITLMVDWKAPAPAFYRAVFNAIETLPEDERDSVIVDFERVEHLRNPTGQMALHSLTAADASLAARVRTAQSEEARAITVLLANKLLFDQALALTYADRLLNGRSWSAFHVRDPVRPRNDPKSIRKLETEISQIFARLDGSGRRLKVDPFERSAVDRTGREGAMSIHYCIYAESLPESHLEFRGSEEMSRRLLKLSWRRCPP